MPYRIIERDDEFCVEKIGDGEIMGCHDSEEGAEDQITALRIAEGEEGGDESAEEGEGEGGKGEEADDARPPALDQKNAREHKALSFELKEVSASGEFEAYASVFGNTDLQGDVMVRGAFAKTIEASGGIIPILDQHDPKIEIGLTTKMTEDEHGLRIWGKLFVDERDPRNEVQAAREAYVKMRAKKRAGLPQKMSIGYRTIKRAWKDGLRFLQEVALGEVSTVTFPANPLAGVVGVKAGGEAARLAAEVDRAINMTESNLLALRELRNSIAALLGNFPGGDEMPGENPEDDDEAPDDDEDQILALLERFARELEQDGDL